MIINQAEALEWIDQLRVTIPEEIKAARRVNSEVDRLLEQAREESEHILARAQEQATYLIEERELTRQAEELSHEIIRQAQMEADQVRRGADDYAADVLVNLEHDVMRVLKQIKGGLDLLDDRRMEAEQAAAAAEAEVMERPAATADGDDAGENEGEDYNPGEYEEDDAEQPVGG